MTWAPYATAELQSLPSLSSSTAYLHRLTGGEQRVCAPQKHGGFDEFRGQRAPTDAVSRWEASLFLQRPQSPFELLRGSDHMGRKDRHAELMGQRQE